METEQDADQAAVKKSSLPDGAKSLSDQLQEVGQDRDFRAEVSLRDLIERLVEGAQSPQQAVGDANDGGATGPLPPRVSRAFHDDGEADVQDALLGTKFGDYELLEEIAQGGMGVVFRARQIGLNREVALKMIAARQLASAEEIRRFYLEAEAAAKLDHPAIVPVYEVGEVDGHHFYSMGLIEGENLAQRLVDGPLAPREAAELLLQVAQAISYAHAQGVIHRDLKPANVMLQAVRGGPPTGSSSGANSSDDGLRSTARSIRPKITDFGLARQFLADSDLTQTGQILGTPRYMPPEQARGETNVGPAADIYSMGAVLYTALTGRPPFHAATTLETLQQVLEQEPVPLRRLNPTIERDLETICLKCLQKKPEHRYLSAAAVAEDLQRYLNDESIVARPIHGFELAWRWGRRQPARAAAIAAGAAMLVTLFVLVLVSSRLSESRATAKAFESEAALRDIQLTAANEFAAAQRRTAETQLYFSLVSRVRERVVEPQIGWAYQGLEDLQRAASLDIESVDRLELRNEAARCLSRVDLRPLAEIRVPPEHEPHLIAFHPLGRQLAIATLGSETELCVLLCDIPNGRISADLRVPVESEWGFDGIRHLAYLKTGKALAIITRSGWLHQWDLTVSPPLRSSVRLPSLEMQPFVFDGDRHRAFFGSEGKLYAWPDLDAPVTTVFNASPAVRLQVSPDGVRLAVATLKDGLQIFDLRTGQLVQQFRDVPGDTCFSPNGRLIAGINMAELVLADVESGRILRRITDPATGRLHANDAWHVRFSPSSGMLMTSGHDQRFKLWDTSSGNLLLSVVIPGADEVRAAFSPDERYVAATGEDRVIVYELNGPNVHGSLAVQADSIEAFDLSPTAGLICCAAGKRDAMRLELSLWDLASDTRLDGWSIPGDLMQNTSVAIRGDGGLCVAGNGANPRLHVWQFDTEALASRQSRAAPPSTALPRSRTVTPVEAWQPVASLLFMDDGFVRVINDTTVTDIQPLAELGVPWDAVDAAITCGDGRAYFFHGDELCEFDVLENRVTAAGPRKIVEHWPGLWERDIDAAFYYRDRLYFFRGEDYLRVDPATRHVDKGYPKSIAANFRGIDPSDYNAALSAAYEDTGLLLFKGESCVGFKGKKTIPPARLISQAIPSLAIPELASQRLRAAVNLSLRTAPAHRLAVAAGHRQARQPAALALSKDGSTLWGAVDSTEVVAWTLPELVERARWSNRSVAELFGIGAISSLAVGREWVVVGAKSGTMNLLRAETAEQVVAVPVDGRVSGVALNQAESLAACGTLDGMVQVSKIPGGEVIACSAAHRDEVTALAFSSDSQLLATTSRDKTMRIWQYDDETFREVLALKLQVPAEVIRFTSDDSQLIVLGQGESMLRVWRLDVLRERLAELSLSW